MLIYFTCAFHVFQLEMILKSDYILLQAIITHIFIHSFHCKHSFYSFVCVFLVVNFSTCRRNKNKNKKEKVQQKIKKRIARNWTKTTDKQMKKSHKSTRCNFIYFQPCLSWSYSFCCTNEFSLFFFPSFFFHRFFFTLSLYSTSYFSLYQIFVYSLVQFAHCQIVCQFVLDRAVRRIERKTNSSEMKICLLSVFTY